MVSGFQSQVSALGGWVFEATPKPNALGDWIGTINQPHACRLRVVAFLVWIIARAPALDRVRLYFR